MSKNMKQRLNFSPKERLDYLQKLIHEFNVTKSKESKRQVLANISSFAYNPINYEFLYKLNITTTLLKTLEESDDKDLKEYAIKGLCNLSNDPKFMLKLIDNGLERIHKCLTENMLNENIIISSLTLFIYSKPFNNQISGPLRLRISETVSHLLKANPNQRIINLSKIYIKN